MMVPLTSRFIELSEIADDVLHGLTASPKSLPPRLFYDARGSELFEQITRLPEYYLTRTERQIFQDHADEIIAQAGPGLTLIELGAGTAAKTSILIQALLKREMSATFYPMDVSAAALEIAEANLSRQFPRLTVKPLVGNYSTGMEKLGAMGGRRLVLYIGSSIGNYEPEEAIALLRSVRRSLSAGDALLLGTDLVKAAPLLYLAYNDAAGVTATFNLNILKRINRELTANFVVENFRHMALWNAEASRIEMYLESLSDQVVRISDLGLRVRFVEGERIHTENSYKFTAVMVERVLTESGFALERTWKDAQSWFGVHLARVEE
jgi:L-histidine N-alpha-methyltransferase